MVGLHEIFFVFLPNWAPPSLKHTQGGNFQRKAVLITNALVASVRIGNKKGTLKIPIYHSVLGSYYRLIFGFILIVNFDLGIIILSLQSSHYITKLASAML